MNATRVDRGGMTPATAGDADLLDKIMYEYRIENFLVCGSCAYFTRRGWGDLAPSRPNHHQGLVEGTQIHFAVPGQELEILQKLMYTYGGVGSEGSALGPAAASGALSRGGRVVPARMIYSFNGMETTAEKLAYIRREADKGIGMAMLTVH